MLRAVTWGDHEGGAGRSGIPGRYRYYRSFKWFGKRLMPMRASVHRTEGAASEHLEAHDIKGEGLHHDCTKVFGNLQDIPVLVQSCLPY
jgi:hypothetical protein